MCGESDWLQAEIQHEDSETHCFFCDDPDCREWGTLFTEPDPLQNGERHVICHVSECDMFDERQRELI